MADHFVKTNDGRIGVVGEMLYNMAWVQFSKEGLVGVYTSKQLTHATREEVNTAGLGGVPGKVWDER
jgi:hypothetical protein